MKITITLLALLLAFLPLAGAQALEGVAVINIQDIMRDSLAAKSVKKKLEAKQKSFHSEMSKKESALQQKEQALSKQRGTLSKAEFEKKVKSFRDSAANAQRDVQAKKSKLDKAFADALNTIQKTVVTIVGEIAKQRNVKVVMPTSQLLYADPSLDITQEVLTKLNTKLPSVKVNF